jgi:16S rRNA G966 N2-methylase RsmD
VNIRLILHNAACQIRTQGLGVAVRSVLRKAKIRWKEWRLGIYTEAAIELSELGICLEEGKHYGPTDYSDFYRIMHAIDIDPRQHVFLDYGAGMGRAMILASTYPFRRVLGVELSPELTSIAKGNFQQCRSKLQCQDIEIATCDATAYQLPPDVTLFYLNNPFHGSILAAVLDKIRIHANSTQRLVLLVCNLPSQSAFEEQIRSREWLELKKELALREDRRCLIFQTRAPRELVAPT